MNICLNLSLPSFSSRPVAAFHCSQAFGLESGKISNDQITASSSFYDEHWLPQQARLNYHDNGWTPNEDSNREYIQVRVGGVNRVGLLKLSFKMSLFADGVVAPLIGSHNLISLALGSD